jgi:cysteine desulfurase
MSFGVYLDYNATAPIRPEAEEAAVCALRLGGNPSSVHATGRIARAAVEMARDQVAALVGASSDAVTFTSGGTEANALAIGSAAIAGARKPIVAMVEHDSVMNNALATGLEVQGWPVDRNGVADLDWLRARLALWSAADGPPFAALALANNETGVIQPIAEVAAILRDAGGWLHVDAVQAAGKIPVDMDTLGADTLALSAHKLGGPMGSGALVAGPRAKSARLLHGGGQERGHRSGTENVSGIAGFGAAAAAALRDLPRFDAQSAWRDAVARRLAETTGAEIVGADAPRLANTLCIATPGWESALQVMALDLAGVRISGGAACSSGKVSPSHVLGAMGLDDLAGCAARASGGWGTQESDWTAFADAWLEAHARHIARRREVA